MWHPIRVKIAEYDFKMQIFIILNQNQKFYNSPKIAEFLKNIAFSTKSAKTIHIRSNLSFIKPINKVAKLPMEESKY